MKQVINKTKKNRGKQRQRDKMSFGGKREIIFLCEIQL